MSPCSSLLLSLALSLFLSCSCHILFFIFYLLSLLFFFFTLLEFACGLICYHASLLISLFRLNMINCEISKKLFWISSPLSIIILLVNIKKLSRFPSSTSDTYEIQCIAIISNCIEIYELEIKNPYLFFLLNRK